MTFYFCFSFLSQDAFHGWFPRPKRSFSSPSVTADWKFILAVKVYMKHNSGEVLNLKEKIIVAINLQSSTT